MSARIEADLHTHTTASDGTERPAANVQMAFDAGLGAIAITDHDTVSGVAEALSAGRELGIEVVPGVEISTVANGQDIHVLGYYIDINNEQFLQRLASLRDTRDTRNNMIIDRLQQLGLDITMAEVLREVENIKSKGDTVGRPHIAAVLLNKGYVSSISEAFDRYLGTGAAAYANPPRIEPATAIGWIQEAGGKAVLAHPGIYHDDALVEAIIHQGLDGIEVYHSDHTPEEEAKYLSLAQRSGLLITAGSDFHGERGGVVFHAPIGSRRIGIDVLQSLKPEKEQRT
ncbi:PHP domain-containing protein [Paenibacillus sp. V4I7]|jgi:predicted metal-dependent phosphoesterase TrpH|uniref:PHP domain-containing protein n=1 Tax=Paenibacillus sp. V4I7 TaxID=3042307 RepID=UPI0027889D41|nr:PHP domain-containing protein [Paenibacillus sp. V4I7]MDF2646756.1 putative metal-dependent phosphoesterase family protein [Paenibacillus sp.]MDQ0899987.1 putative metal-dependent phosphoesterase TrpH [Paenibacillus sp. V4I7]